MPELQNGSFSLHGFAPYVEKAGEEYMSADQKKAL